ncbi:hypothetical protein K2X33_09555 [bacterium]|nr:hypothetical protein [bacterium]
MLAVLSGLAAPARASTVELSCAQLVSRAIESIAAQRPTKIAAKIRKKATLLQEKIEDRVRARCPRPESCSPARLALITSQITQDAISRELYKPASWRVYPVFGAALAGLVALNVFSQDYLNQWVASSLTTLITIISVMTIDHLGASSLETPLSHIRLWGYQQTASEDIAGLRGAAQRRLNEIYQTTQQLLTSIEEEARATDRQAKLQTVLAQVNCRPYAGECSTQFMERAANVFAKLLSDIVPTYPELEFAEHEYADWAKVTFSQWFLDDSNRDAFRARVLLLIQERFDEDAKPDTAAWRAYEAVLYDWTAPLLPVPAADPPILPPGSHQ